MPDNTIQLNENQSYFDHWRELSPMDNAILRVIEAHGGEIRQAEIRAILGAADVSSVSRSITKLARFGILAVTKSGRTNRYRSIFLAQIGEQQLIATVNNSQTVSNKQTTDNNKEKKVKSVKRDLTETDYDNARHFGFQLEAPVTCARGKPTLYDALRGKRGHRISDTLQDWREADEAGTLDTTYKGKPMSANLMACKIIECQAPPEITPDTRDSASVPNQTRPAPVFSHPDPEPTPEPKNNIVRELTSHRQFGGLFAGCLVDGDKVRLAPKRLIEYQGKRGKWITSPDDFLRGMGLEIECQAVG